MAPIARPAATTATHDDEHRNREGVPDRILAELGGPRLVDLHRCDLGAVGREQQQPTSDGHIAVTVARAMPAASPIGTSVRVVADWLVVSPQTRNSATARNSGCRSRCRPSHDDLRVARDVRVRHPGDAEQGDRGDDACREQWLFRAPCARLDVADEQDDQRAVNIISSMTTVMLRGAASSPVPTVGRSPRTDP